MSDGTKEWSIAQVIELEHKQWVAEVVERLKGIVNINDSNNVFWGIQNYIAELEEELL